MTLSEEMRSCAQNDHMIDQHFLPTGALLNRGADELDRLRALLTPPDLIGHTHEWVTVSAMGGPRKRCKGCGFLGLPADME